MTALLEKILSLSTTASFLMVAVIVLRFVLKKAPKGMRYFLWAMVGLRLLFPFEIESPFSVLPSKNELQSVSTPSTTVSVNTAPVLENEGVSVLEVLAYIWLAGAVLMLLYMLISFVRVHLMVRESVKYKDGIYLCDHVNSPFVLGVIKPKIYLNSEMSKRDMNLIIAHERTHIKHFDNIWKPLGFVLLCVYWFNPLCWVSYFLFVKDIELFCDESVVKNLSEQDKKNYSYALLSCSMSKNIVTACPLAFAENSVKTRVKNILSYKKPALYIIVISATLCVFTMLMFMTNPVSAKEIETVEKVSPTVVETIAETSAPTVAPTEAETEAPTQAPTEKLTESLNEIIEVDRNNSDIDYNENEDVVDNEENETESNTPNDSNEQKEYSVNSINPNTNPESLSLSSDTGHAQGAILYNP